MIQLTVSHDGQTYTALVSPDLIELFKAECRKQFGYDACMYVSPYDAENA